MKTLLAFTLLLSTPLFAMSDTEAVRICLKHFGTHPFNVDAPKFRTISPSVKVFGIGKGVIDKTSTDKPELILVKSAVSVLSKTTYELKNPNGWYCLNGKVAVLANTIIQLDCKAKLASTDSTVTVLGKSEDPDKGGVTVLGKTKVTQVNCQ